MTEAALPAETSPADAQPRPLGLAARRGLAGRCPHCGEGRLYRAYLKVVDACPVCGEDLSPQRADDAPAYVTMLIVGHFVVAGALAAEEWRPNSPVLARRGDLGRADRRPILVAAAARQRRPRRLPVGDAHARFRRL